MARPGLGGHRKFRRLVQSLVPHAGTIAAAVVARGVLEAIWEVGYENGDSFLGSVEDVELIVGWGGEPGALCKMLVDAGGRGEAGFIEKVSRGYQIHDLYDHAPDYVQRRLRREMDRQARGVTISSIRSDAAKKRQPRVATDELTATTEQQVEASGGQLLDTDLQTEQTVLTPAPAPALKEKESAEQSGGSPIPITKKPANSWVKPYDEDWQERFGASIPIGEACSAIAPLRTKHGGDAGVRPVWQWYLRTQPAEYVSPMAFGKKFFHWREAMNGKARPDNARSEFTC